MTCEQGREREKDRKKGRGWKNRLSSRLERRFFCVCGESAGSKTSVPTNVFLFFPETLVVALRRRRLNRVTQSGVSCFIDDSVDRESAAGHAFRARRGAADWSGGPQLSDSV